MFSNYTLLVLLAALLHASWNVLIKLQGERLACLAWMSIFASICWLPILVYLPPLGKEAVPLLIITSLFHLLYKIALAKAYDYGDFAQVYPIARGSAPLLATILAIPLAGEWLSISDLFSLFLIIGGVLLLSWNGRRIELSRSVLWAIATGICIACYTVADGLGGRATINALTFAGYQCVVDGISIFIVAAFWHPNRLSAILPNQWHKLLIAAIFSATAYAIIIFVMSQTKIGAVAALRETSVLWAVLMGVVFLKEKFGKLRIIATLVILSGVISLRLS
ncbi:MAG: EamA family transporter [Deltaproteobacteria bacterium]|nr:EamA family transporter [Deltaproteobacteria bacterium]